MSELTYTQNRLEDVFKLEGVPTHTFVSPSAYNRLVVALRTPRRGVVVEGPSGIGKTCSVSRALNELGISMQTQHLSARKASDLEIIQSLPELGDVGTVIIDDFHKLHDDSKRRLADYAKLLADDESLKTKLILIGINDAGSSLIQFASDLNGRIDFIEFEVEPADKIRALVEAGERALNVTINVKDEIIAAAQGSFYLAQMLAHETCLEAKILESKESLETTAVSFETVRAHVLERLDRKFKSITQIFAQGKRARPDGRAPYLHLLKWLAESDEWTINVRDMLAQHSELRNSINQVIEKNHVIELINSDQDLAKVLHYEASSGQFGAEDPQFVFYLRSLSWDKFARSLGYSQLNFSHRYDVALSFAGADRPFAEQLFNLFTEQELECFYDKNEQHRILATDVEEYLRPIYQSDAKLVVCLLGADYPKRIWTKFESDSFKERFDNGEVVPVWFDNAPPSLFDRTKTVGGVDFKVNENMELQARKIVELVGKKLRDMGGVSTAGQKTLPSLFNNI